MKRLFEFEVLKEDEVDESTESINESGDKVVTHKKVKKKVPHKFFIAKPTRKLNDESNLIYGVNFAGGVKAGLLTISQLEKRNSNDGGVFSEPEKKQFESFCQDLFKSNEEFQRLAIIEKDKRTPEETTRYDELVKKITELQVKIQEYQAFRNSLYDHTAEVRARNITITWWLAHLAHKIEGDKEVLFFGDGTYEQRLDKYDELLEGEDPFYQEVIENFLLGISIWATDRAKTQQEFEEAIKLFREKNLTATTERILLENKKTEELPKVVAEEKTEQKTE